MSDAWTINIFTVSFLTWIWGESHVWARIFGNAVRCFITDLCWGIVLCFAVIGGRSLPQTFLTARLMVVVLEADALAGLVTLVGNFRAAIANLTALATLSGRLLGGAGDAVWRLKKKTFHMYSDTIIQDWWGVTSKPWSGYASTLLSGKLHFCKTEKY